MEQPERFLWDRRQLAGRGLPDGTVPGPADTADLESGTINGAGTVDTLLFGGSETVGGSLTALTNVNQFGGVLVIGSGGAITAPHFSQSSDAAYLLLQPGAVVTLTGTISNPGPTSYPDAMYVAASAIFDGARINAGGQINIGSATRVTSVTATDGSSVRFWAANVGDATGEAATLLVSGAGTTWSDVGGSDGSGGYLLVGSGFPNSVGTSGTVTIVAGALLANAGDVRVGVGAGSSGTLIIAAGGRMTSAGGDDQIGSTVGSTGIALIDGAGSTWSEAGRLDIGSSGAGAVQVSSGGSVHAGAGLSVGSAGALSILSGGVVGVTGGANVSASGTVSLTGGALAADTVAVAAAGLLGGNGVVSGAVADNGTITATGGTLELTGPVSGAGTFVITPGATLRLDDAVAAGSTIKFASGGTGRLELTQASLVQATIIGQQSGDVIGLPPTVDTVQGGGGGAISVDFGATALAVLAAPLLAGTSPASTLFITAPGSFAMTAGLTTAAIDTAVGAVTLSGNGVANETIAAGSGAFAFQGGAGGSGTVVAGAGADSIYLPGGGNWGTYLGNGADTVVAATGDDTVATGSGGSFVFLGAGASSVASSGADTILGATGAADCLRRECEFRRAVRARRATGVHRRHRGQHGGQRRGARNPVRGGGGRHLDVQRRPDPIRRQRGRRYRGRSGRQHDRAGRLWRRAVFRGRRWAQRHRR